MRQDGLKKSLGPNDDVVVPDHIEIASRAAVLCPLPVSVQRVLAEVAATEVDFSRVAAAIKLDAALTTGVLQSANASYYRRREPVTDVHRAVVQLGGQEIQSVALAHAMVAAFASRHERSGIVQARCALAAALARELASDVRVNSGVAYLAGLLSDLGALVCLAVDGDSYGDLDALPLPLRSMGERDRYGATSRAVGAHLLRSHGLPAELVDAIGAEDEEDVGPLARLTRYCRAASAACVSLAQESAVEELLRAELDALGDRERLGVDSTRSLELLLALGGEVGRVLNS